MEWVDPLEISIPMTLHPTTATRHMHESQPGQVYADSLLLPLLLGAPARWLYTVHSTHHHVQPHLIIKPVLIIKMLWLYIESGSEVKKLVSVVMNVMTVPAFLMVNIKCQRHRITSLDYL